jgi:hypothetical protein
MPEYSKAQLDWMQHSVGRKYELRQSPGRLDWDERMRVQLEHELGERVLRHLHNRLPLDKLMQVMADYLVQHADLQIRRYARQIDDVTFYQRCYAAHDALLKHPLFVYALKQLIAREQAAMRIA